MLDTKIKEIRQYECVALDTTDVYHTKNKKERKEQ